MSTPNGSGGQYQVVYSGRARIALKGLLQKAKDLGWLAEVKAAVKKIDGYLQTPPATFGEPVYELPDAHLQVRKGVVSPLVITYGVDEANHLVHVGVPIIALPSSGL